jgi:AraC-like DNA-binding protein
VTDLEEHHGVAVLRAEIIAGTSQLPAQASDLLIGILFGVFRAILGERWRPVSVHLAHAAPDDGSVHRRFFGPDVVFDSEFNAIASTTADLGRRSATADPELAAFAKQFIDSLPNVERVSIASEVQEAIHMMLPLGDATIARVARRIGLTDRTLQNRLNEEGVSFSVLLNTERRNLAMRYVAVDRYALTEVAELLGYARLGSFTRWFIGQFGASPTKWRTEAPADQAA